MKNVAWYWKIINLGKRMVVLGKMCENMEQCCQVTCS
jgi:hypothetical protein